MNARALIAAVSVALSVVAFSFPTASAAVPDYIAHAVADPSRPADDRKLDVDRKPADVLAYAEVKPGQTIGEFLPGGGYYTRLLSDIVGPSGKIYALETSTWGADNINAAEAVLNEPERKNVSLDLAPLGQFRLPEQVDMFWTTINYHDLHIRKYAIVDTMAFNRHVFDSLKPGGVYFIVDHVAPDGTGATLSPKLHRIEKTTVVKEVTAAGFRLAGESDILRNPADDHTKVVFDPSIRFKTDQFILKFVKP
jgi:predicted methyltransferase